MNFALFLFMFLVNILISPPTIRVDEDVRLMPFIDLYIFISVIHLALDTFIRH